MAAKQAGNWFARNIYLINLAAPGGVVTVLAQSYRIYLDNEEEKRKKKEHATDMVTKELNNKRIRQDIKRMEELLEREEKPHQKKMQSKDLDIRAKQRVYKFLGISGTSAEGNSLPIDHRACRPEGCAAEAVMLNRSMSTNSDHQARTPKTSPGSQQRDISGGETNMAKVEHVAERHKKTLVDLEIERVQKLDQELKSLRAIGRVKVEQIATPRKPKQDTSSSRSNFTWGTSAASASLAAPMRSAARHPTAGSPKEQSAALARKLADFVIFGGYAGMGTSSYALWFRPSSDR